MKPSSAFWTVWVWLLGVSGGFANAHQMISYPRPITRDPACRMGFNADCPGPCPRRLKREDLTPNNPSITVSRGQWITVNTMKNNHGGGFSRWSLVHVRDMYNHQKHRQNAFLYTCADINLSKCSKRWKWRDCYYDLKDEYYRHPVQIPLHVPDGVYVLGWVWYGGGGTWGNFGDYYDCIYIKVSGGPTAWQHVPLFRPGNSVYGDYGKCRATVNEIGKCWGEPCPGGGKFTQFMKPKEFENGSPPAIPRSRYANPYRQKRRGNGSPWVKSMTIRSAEYPAKVYSSTYHTHNPYLYLTRRMRPTVTCECGGKVKSVTFYVNGIKGRTDYDAPYSIAGDWKHWKYGYPIYAAWKHNIDRKVLPITCKVTGHDGSEHSMTIELSTNF